MHGLQAAMRLAARTLVDRQEQWPRLGRSASSALASADKINGKYYRLIGTMSPGFVVLSYFMSFVGSLCTLELLLRRTSNRGATNLILLTAAGICFGAVSTFAMHFVGNQSLSLHFPDVPAFDGYQPFYLSYKGGYTVLSLVAACLAMTFAFFVMGTDIHFSEWRTWPCIPGSKHRTALRDPDARWKNQKSRIRGSANVTTIFQQAGIVANWPLSSASRLDVSRRPQGWREWLFGTPHLTTSESPVQFDAYNGDDEDLLVKHDKHLGELDFRLGRGAVRDEIDRRQMGGTLVDLASPDPSESGINVVTRLPTSPLAAYYFPGASFPVPSRPPPAKPPPIRPPSPSDNFVVPGYQFPPRTPVDNDSTANLLPRSGSVPPAGGPAWTEVPPDAVIAAPRRGSLPTHPLNPSPHPRLGPPNTLSRIQSLPEHDGDAAVTSTTPRFSDDTKDDTDPRNSGSRPNSHYLEQRRRSSMDRESYDTLDSMTNWRSQLRKKIESGEELTRLERLERFFGLDVVKWSDIIKILLTGVIAGCGVAGMHYIGQVSITGIPYIGYRVGNVVGSVVIACGAVIIALYIMFIILRPKAQYSWMSKIGVAIILAGAVCGMHYCAMKGTIYGWDAGRPQTPTGNTTKRAITGLVAALAFLACLGITVFIMINSIRERKERARRRRVVVASVLLDDQGRMLVSAIDGLLPMCDIASLASADYPPKIKASSASLAESTTLSVDLTTGNDAFVQAMKMSWSWRNPFWSSLNPFASATDVSAMGPAFTAPPQTPMPSEPQPTRRASTLTAAESLSSAVINRVSVSRFLEKFAVSATQLASRVTGRGEGISRLGVLYDQILTTGWVRLHNSKDTVSKGQLIFLVRRVKSSQERDDLLSRHFIFADTVSVANALHRTLSTPFDLVMPFLEDMRLFCDNTMRMTLRPNTLYAGVAVVQATPWDGLRILLNRTNRSQLPMTELCTFSTLPGLPVNVADGLAGTLDEIGEAVTWLEGMNLLSVITRNMSTEATRIGGPRVGRLLAALERAIVPMLDELLTGEDMAYILPRLTLHPVLVPLTPATTPRKGQPGWAAPHIIVLYANYDVAVNNFCDKWLPFKLFRAQHECVMASKIGALTRVTSSAEVPQSAQVLGVPNAGSPALSPGLSASTSSAQDPAARYSYARRPSKVQFEVPLTDASLAPLPSDGTVGTATGSHHTPGAPSIDNGAPGSPATTASFPTWSSRDRGLPRRSSLARSVFTEPPEPFQLTRPGVAAWDPNWLVNLLRTRLRAEA